MKYFFFLIIIFNILFNKITYCAESYVVFKVNNQIITNVDIDTKYDLDEFYKNINDLVPDYKLKVFRMLKKMATGEFSLTGQTYQLEAFLCASFI